MSSISDEVLETEDRSSPGSRLQKAREALGISQKSLADDLYLPRNYILWIEEGAYEKLPSMVFCRGYIRAYAKLVNESGEELIELLDNIYGNQNIKAPLMSVSKINEQVKVGDPIMKWSSLLFIIILCGLVFWWWKTQYGLNAPFLSSQEPIAVETANGNELALPSLDNTTVIETSNAQLSIETSSNAVSNLQEPVTSEFETVTSDQSAVVNNGNGIELALNIVDEKAEAEQLIALEKVVAAIEPETATVSTQTVVTNELVSATVDAKLLQIAFDNECWVTIKDARGKILFNGIKKSGQQLSLSGDMPLNVSIGRVDSVSKITFGGADINIDDLGRNNIANFKLPL
ncbi:MAG: RodZ family helix-turn-helix domain-containing protein [Oceanospirillaceae bacterium]